MTDDILDEVRANREALAAKFGFDPMAMVLDMLERERLSGRVLIQPPLRKVPEAEQPAALPEIGRPKAA